MKPSEKVAVNWYSPEIPLERSQELVVTWVGHATVLIQVAGINILTDPIFGNSSILFPRIIKPGITLEQLPPIDLVLISHNHLDHMEGSCLKFLAKKFPGVIYLVPQGNKSWFDKRSIAEVTEAAWWQTYTFNEGACVCTFLPAVHWTQRSMFDRNKSLWGSWMIEVGERCIYFGGDTAYGQHFEAIAAEFPSIDVAILPIGPCEPRNAMKHAHMDSYEALQAFKILQAKHFFPIHWGTFHFGNESAYLPIDRLTKQWNKTDNDSHALLHIPKAGTKVFILDDKITKQGHLELLSKHNNG